MKGRVFRDRASTPASEALALDPKAFGFLFFFSSPKENEKRGPVTIVTIEGPLEHRGGFFWDGYDSILDRFTSALEDGETETVLLRIDSPGGECAGLFECVRQMREVAEASGKRVVAYADEGAYSAAYALASVASEIYLPPAGGLGSIGVITSVVDRTARNKREGFRVEVVKAGARKADGHPDVPLEDDALERIQARVDGLAELFFDAVASSRPLSSDEVRALEAGCFYGEEAVDAGLADGVMGLSELLEELGAVDAEDQDTAGASSSDDEGEIEMNRKTKTATASAPASSEPIDILKDPIVEGSNRIPVASAAPARAEEEKESEHEDCEDEEEKEDAEEEDAEGEEKEETEGKGSEEDAEEEPAEEDEEEEESEDEEKEDKAAARAPSASSTTRDVLAAVRELTGERSPARQIGALTAMRDGFKSRKKLEARLERLEKENRHAKVTAKVSAAIKAGKLTPAQRAWAVETGMKDLATLDSYLKTAQRVVAPTAPLREPKPKGAVAKQPTAAGEPELTREELEVAENLHVDPRKLAAHKREIASVTTSKARH